MFSVEPVNLPAEYECPEFIGFGFHDNCWQLVSRVASPQSPPMTRLFEVCMFIYVYRQNVDYFFEIHISPSVRLFIGKGDGTTIIDNQPNDYPYHVWDPVHPVSQETQLDTKDFMEDSVLRDFLEGLFRQAGPPPGSIVERIPGCDRDYFTRLPLELRCEICEFLPLAAFLHLRRASLAFSPMFYMPRYWYSFFRRFAHWGFVSGLLRPYGCHDWRGLCKVLALALLNDNNRDILKRCELWRLAEDMIDATSLEWATDTPYVGAGLDETTVTSPNKISYQSQDMLDLQASLHPFLQTFLSTRKQAIEIPKNLEAVKIWHRMVGCVKYITGISFITEKGHVTRLGHYGGRGHEWIQIDGKPITGIRARVGERCFESLCFYTREDSKDVLLGQSRGALRPETSRLMGSAPIESMEFGFDVRRFEA